jgi:hypothetical protein
MAGDWVKMRVALAYDLKVTRIARIINQGLFLSTLAPNAQLEDGACNVAALQLLVVGALHKFWCAAQEITVDGILRNCDASDVDQMVGIYGFADALIEVGWLIKDEGKDCLIISNFQEHNGEGAKKRAQTNKRVAKHRDEKRSSVTEMKRGSVTREEKRRDKSITDAPEGFDAIWTFFPKRAGGNPKTRAVAAYRARLGEGHEPDEILAGVRRYAAFIKATGKEGTEYVKQAATFLGPEKAFLEPWDLPREAKESPLYRREGVM